MAGRSIQRRAALTGMAAALAPRLARGATQDPIRIGYQRYSSLIVMRNRGILEKALEPLGVPVVWSEFVAGPQLLQALAAGAIDLGETGDAPPIFAEASAPCRLVYIGYEPPAPTAEGLIVPKGSPIRKVADLRGKRVALNRGSNVHWFLLEALRKNGLAFSDIHATFLTPPAARAAFEGGQLDAWAIWDPYFSAALDVQPVILTTAEGIVANREFFLASRAIAEQRPKVLQAVCAAIAQTDIWANDHLDDVARILSDETKIAFPNVRHAMAQRHFAFHPMDAAVIAEQQAVADGLLAAGLLPRGINIAKAVWTAP